MAASLMVEMGAAVTVSIEFIVLLVVLGLVWFFGKGLVKTNFLGGGQGRGKFLPFRLLRILF